jgi:2,4-dienoyl-CoA reductase [(3E)-enoyl-CoA-producing], peroxisomal
MALEWGTNYGIRVNGIAPGPIEGTTGMDILSPKEFLGDLWKNQPLYKEGEKWDVAMVIIYLASDTG